MSARLRDVDLHSGSLAASAAEVWVRAVAERDEPGLEVRGRLLGPRCRFAATVEVAYPLRPFVQTPPGYEGLAGRIVIPEASLWDPESPFLYQGAIELWQDGRMGDRVAVSHGLRALRWTERGLHVNGRLLTLRGREIASLTEAEALALRADGCNLLVVPVREETAPLWELADRIGFLVIGRCADVEDERLAALAQHASCLGWLIEGNQKSSREELSGIDIVVEGKRMAALDGTGVAGALRFRET